MHKRKFYRLSLEYEGDKVDHRKRDELGFRGFIDEYGSPRKPKKQTYKGRKVFGEVFYFESKSKGKRFIKKHNLHPEVTSINPDGTKKAYAKHFWWE